MTIAINQNEEELEQCLFDALIELMRRMPLDKLTVNDLLKQAHVSRSSFYRRYQDKYDLVNKSYQKILDKTLYTFLDGCGWHDSVKALYQVFQENLFFYQNALRSHDPNSLRNYIFQISLNLYAETLERNGEDIQDWHTMAMLRVHIYGNLELMCEWVEKGMDRDIDEMIQLSFDTLPEQFKPYFND